MGVFGVEIVLEQQLCVRARAVGAPEPLAISDVVRADVAANAELAARDAHDEFAVRHHPGAGHRLTLRRVAVLRLPDLLARVGVQGDDLGVQRDHQDLSLGVVEAAVHGVAAGNGNGPLVLLGSVLPLERLVGARQVDRVDVVGKRAVRVHRGANDQRCALVTLGGASGHGPGDLELLDVRRRDLTQRAVASARVVLTGHDPLRVVVLQLLQLIPRLLGVRRVVGALGLGQRWWFGRRRCRHYPRVAAEPRA